MSEGELLDWVEDFCYPQLLTRTQNHDLDPFYFFLLLDLNFQEGKGAGVGCIR